MDDKIPERIFEINPRVMDLNITSGNVQFIQKNAFVNAQSLNFLTLLENRIKELPGNTFTGAKLLYTLDLRQNRITFIDGKAFYDLEFLSYLYLDENQLEIIDSNVFQPLKRLFKLTLSNNRIKSVHPNMVYGCYKLDHLDLSRNLLSEKMVLQNKFNEIRLINIADNRINDFELSAENSVAAKALQLTLIARNNELRNVTVSSNYNLSYLNLYDNRLESITFIVKDHCNISYINIGKNPLRTPVPLKHNFRNLKYLNMTMNNFNNLSNNAFAQLPELQILDLSNVVLAQPMQLKSLEHLNKLEMLDVSNVYLNESQSELRDILKKILPNLKCLKYNFTNGWVCQIPLNDGTLDWDDRAMNINIEINSREVPMWMKFSFVSSIGILVLVCVLGLCIRRKRHQVINNINVGGSTATELEML